MVLITLIGEKLAVEGLEFTYVGANSDCKKCKLKTVCFHLKPGRDYTITNIRDKKHTCNVHEGNAVIVEVNELPFIAAAAEEVSEGTKTVVERKKCKNIGCSFFEICTNRALQDKKTYTIKKTFGKIDCPLGYDLYKVELMD